MRLVGITPDTAKADQFVHFLRAMGTESLVRPDGDRLGVWVVHEDQWTQAKQDWVLFEQNPDDSKFQKAKLQLLPAPAPEGPADPQELPQEQESEVGGIVPQPLGAPTWYPATATLALAAVMVGFLTSFGDEKNELFRSLTFGPISETGVVGYPAPSQAWRVFTPALIHLSLVQLLFHLIMLQDLGGQVEQKLGKARFVSLVLFLVLVGNLAEGYLGPTRQFGGMAGLVFGLFGFIWIRAAFTPWSGFHLPVTTSILLIAWFLFSLDGKMIPPSHWAQIVGFLAGAAVAWLTTAGIKRDREVAAESSTIP